MGSNLRLAEGEPFDLYGLSLLMISNSEILRYNSLDWTNLMFPGILPFAVLLYGCNLF